MTTRTKTIRYALGNTIEKQQAFDSVFFDASGSFTDESTDSADVGTADVTIVGASGNIIYLGSSSKFCGFWFDASTNPAGGTRTWTYWNGSTWTAMPTMTYITGNANLTADTAAHWDDTAMTGWATTTVNSASKYWIRGTVGTAYTTAGVASVITGAIWHNLCSGSTGGTRTIDIPETSGRTFRSAVLRIVFQTPILGQIDLSRVRVKVGSGTLTNLEADNAIAISPNLETHTYVMEYDATALFTSDFSSTSHAVEAEFCSLYRNVMNSAGENYVHYSAMLDITYDFDDNPANNATQIETVLIPFDSLTSALGTTITTIGGTGGIPILTGGSGFIKEVSSPTIKEECIVFLLNNQEGGAINYDFYGQIDSESETLLATFNAANNSDAYFEMQWRRTDLTSTSAHDIKARVSGATGAAPVHVGGYIIVTYTYSASGVTTKNFSAMIPYCHNPTLFAGTSSSSKKVSSVRFHVPMSATLQASAIVHYHHQFADPGNLVLGVGSQTPQSFVATPDTVAGPVPEVVRFDSGGVAGSGLTLSKGWNTLNISSYVDSNARNGGGEYGFIILNFYYTITSGKRMSHARYNMSPYDWTIQARQLISSFSVPIPESNYLLSVAGVYQWDFSQSAIQARSIAINKGSSLGWYHGVSGSVGEMDTNWGSRITAEDLTRFFLRCPTDPNTDRLDIETARDFMSEGGNTRFSTGFCAMWHDYAISVSRALTDYSGAGSGIAVNIWSKALGEKIASVTTSSGGGYSFTWYDDTTSDLYAEAQQDGTHVGRSADFTAS